MRSFAEQLFNLADANFRQSLFVYTSPITIPDLKYHPSHLYVNKNNYLFQLVAKRPFGKKEFGNFEAFVCKAFNVIWEGLSGHGELPDRSQRCPMKCHSQKHGNIRNELVYVS